MIFEKFKILALSTSSQLCLPLITASTIYYLLVVIQFHPMHIIWRIFDDIFSVYYIYVCFVYLQWIYGIINEYKIDSVSSDSYIISEMHWNAQNIHYSLMYHLFMWWYKIWNFCILRSRNYVYNYNLMIINLYVFINYIQW